MARRHFGPWGMVMFALAFLGVGLYAQPRPAGDVKDPGPATPHIRILSYNIHHAAGNETCPAPAASGDCGLDLRRIADIIRDSGADIVGLQEVDRFWKRSGLVDQPKELAGMLGMFPCFGANLRLSEEAGSGHPREYGTLLLSRYPLRNCSNAPLPRVSDASEQRGLLSAIAESPMGRLRVMVTHLSVVAEDRALQAPSLLRSLKASTLPTVLLGDLNMEPEESNLQLLVRQMADPWSLSTLPKRPAPSGFTYPCHPQQQPNRRIDYILLSPGLAAASAEVLDGAGPRMASDHCPILVPIGLGEVGRASRP